jgi:predicted nucleic acid-binding protein
MTHYADSSFLVSCYLADQNTPAAEAWLLSVGATLPFTPLHALEVRNAFQLGVFRGLITAADAASALDDLRSDLRGGRLVETSINWRSAMRMAAALSGKHTAVIGARSLDILHLAVARSIRAREMISFDMRQRSLASAIGLRVSP